MPWLYECTKYQVLIQNRTVQYCTVIPCGTYVCSTVLVCGVMMRCEVEEEGNVQVKRRWCVVGSLIVCEWEVQQTASSTRKRMEMNERSYE